MTASEDKDTRLALGKELENLRAHIKKEELILFIGEQVSVLEALGKAKPSLEDWWEALNTERGLGAIHDLENKFLEAQQKGQSRVHNALRNVGKFHVIITTNMDELLEGFLWKSGTSGEKIRIDQVALVAQSWPKLRRDLIIKCYGDGSFNGAVQPNAKEYFEDFCGSLESKEVDFLRQLFNERPVLFLGCDLSDPVYEKFLLKFTNNAKVPHFLFEPAELPGLTRQGSLNILKADLQIWEFVQFLSTGSIEANLSFHGQVYERSYLRTQREEYLLQQLELEKQASEIFYHTMAITNALSPDEYFDQISRRSIVDIIKNDSFGVYSEEKVNRTMDAMKARRDNLHELIKGKTRVTALFFNHKFKAEIGLWRGITPQTPAAQKKEWLLKSKISISKYAKVALLCNSFMKSGSSFDIRVVGGLTKEEMKEMTRETFALIRLRGGTDEAICYAETAIAGERNFSTHLVNINGDEVANKRKVYEKSRARAWSSEDSLSRVVTTVLKEHEELKVKFEVAAIQKGDLENLKTLSRINHKVASKLDADTYLEPLGEGSFGQVFKARRNGEPVAVKILKNQDDVRAIENFEREVDTLREASHPNIVRVIDCIVIQNDLSILMEFMAGGNLKNFLARTPGQGQNKEFTLNFTEGIGSAIGHLHSLNLMHRDVKPENIFLSGDTSPVAFKLGDFGLARATKGTQQTKTMIGSYRYMAPEVLKSVGRYSHKADVHSFGLCLIEVLSGKEVFSDIPVDKTVQAMKADGQKPTMPEIPEEDFGAELCMKLRVIIEECLKAEHSRPSMQRVLQILKERVVAQEGGIELFCVGTGQGSTAVIHGKPSSSVIVFHDNEPLLMVDVGQGVTKACLDNFGEDRGFPENVFITHNHLDHAGELPVFFYLEARRRFKEGLPKLRILCGPEVEEKIKTHRLNEMLSMYTPEQVADWVVCHQEGGAVFLDNKQFYIKVHRSLHGETCYGFVLYFQGNPILGYSADSGFERSLYEFIFQAPTVVVDARLHGSKEHASFSEVKGYVATREKGKQSKHPTAVYITGYGTEAEYPDEGLKGVQPLLPNQYVTLLEGKERV